MVDQTSRDCRVSGRSFLTSQSIGGNKLRNFDMLDAKIASALKKIITNPYIQEESQNLEEQKAQMQDRFLCGRQIAYLIVEYFPNHWRMNLDFSDLFSISSHGDDIQDFDTRWDQALLSTSEVPNDSILESLYKMRLRQSVQLQTVLAMYEEEHPSRSIETQLIGR